MLGEQTDKEASREERERVAVHELGHAIAAEVLRPGSVSQVALSPRGQALGYVRHHPNEDRHLYTRQYIEKQILVCLAGSAAEKEVYGNRSTGSQNDFDQANRYTRLLIESGLSELGIINPELISKEKMQEEASRILEELDSENCTFDRTPSSAIGCMSASAAKRRSFVRGSVSPDDEVQAAVHSE